MSHDKVIAPNGLPLTYFRGDVALEHEHADHLDYKFPVEVDYLGPCDPEHIEEEALALGYEPTEEAWRAAQGEVHALIYTDGHIAVTLNEHCYGFFFLANGLCWGGGQCVYKNQEWKLTEESTAKIIEYAKRMGHD